MPIELSRRHLVGAAAVAAPLATATQARAAAKPRPHDPRLPDPAKVDVSEPADLSLLECASALQAGRLSSRELTRACLQRARERDGATTAWRGIYPDYAMQLATAADKRLATARRTGRPAPLVTGVPLALKDLYAAKGLPLTASSQVLAGHRAAGDSTAWARLKAAGMVLLGHSETDEFAFGSATAQTGNPWDPTRSPGGSSGGSGSLLGARLVPAALGTDTGGSLRFPAALCGVTSVKPTFGRVSAYGVIPLIWNNDHCGPMARSAADASLLLSYLAGYDPHDPITLTAPTLAQTAYPTQPSMARKPYAGLRFGVVTAAVEQLPAATAKVMARFLKQVQQLGGTLVDVTLPAGANGGSAKTNVSTLGETGVYHSQFLSRTGRYGPVYQAVVSASVAASQAATVGDTMRYAQGRVRFAHGYNKLFVQHRLTALLLPTTYADGPMRSDVAGVTILSDGPLGEVGFANAAGVPVVNTPVGRSGATGMPFGVQIAGRAWDELRLLRIAIDYQHRYPYWAEAPPALTVPRAIPTAQVTAVTAHTDPTGTWAARPGYAFTPTRDASPTTISPTAG